MRITWAWAPDGRVDIIETARHAATSAIERWKDIGGSNGEGRICGKSSSPSSDPLSA
jgi:hypothetical protein